MTFFHTETWVEKNDSDHRNIFFWVMLCTPKDPPNYFETHGNASCCRWQLAAFKLILELLSVWDNIKNCYHLKSTKLPPPGQFIFELVSKLSETNWLKFFGSFLLTPPPADLLPSPADLSPRADLPPPPTSLVQSPPQPYWLCVIWH